MAGITQVGAKAVLNPGTADETWGICIQSEVSPEATKHEIQNGEGDTVALMYTDTGRKKYVGTFVPLAGATLNHLPGSTLVIGDLTIVIDNATLTRKRGDVPEYKIEGSYYPNVSASGGGGGGGN